MAIRDDLEAALRETPSVADLSVYGDLLQETGTREELLRGQLCVLDLAPGGDPWRAERGDILEQWLGDLGGRAKHLVRYGFVHELHGGLATEVLNSPLGEFVCSFATGGLSDQAEATTDDLWQLASSERPWLRRLAINWQQGSPCEQSLRDALIRATPNLVEMYSLGYQCFDSFHHKSLEHLYVSPEAARPATNATLSSVDDCGYLTGRLVLEDFQLSIILEAIKMQDNCRLLGEVYEEMLEPHDSVSTLLVRLHEAGLVQLNGTQVQLTKIGKCLVHLPEEPQQSRRVPSWTVDGKWYLWVEGHDRHGNRLLFNTHVRRHIQVLRACLSEFAMAVDMDVHEAVCDYIDFVQEAYCAHDSGDDKLSLRNPIKLLGALRALATIEALEERHNLALFDTLNALDCDFARSGLHRLIALLEAHQGASANLRFWVVWGC